MLPLTQKVFASVLPPQVDITVSPLGAAYDATNFAADFAATNF